MRTKVAVVLTVAMVATSAVAEVRLVSGPAGPGLSVHPVRRGVWTVSGAPDAATINAAGDALGDGFPGQATGDGALIAAWQRPAHDSLVLLRATGSLTPAVAEVPAAGGFGTPLVNMVGSNALVVWQSHGADEQVVGLVAEGATLHDAAVLFEGHLVDVVRVGDSLHVLGYHAADAALVDVIFPMFHEPNPLPIIPLTRVPVPNPQFLANGPSPCIGARDGVTLVAWPIGRGAIERLVLTEGGVAGIGDTMRGPDGSCDAILNAASTR